MTMRARMTDAWVPTRKILFHHIPKTAGTALIEQAGALSGLRLCPARYDADLTDAAIEAEDFTFYHGHFSFEMVQRFRSRNPDAFVFTFLRHPFSRVLSQYHNWTDRRRVEHEFAQIAQARPDDAHVALLRDKFERTILAMSLDDFLRSDDPDVRHVVDNLQAQYLTSHDRPAWLRLQSAVPNALLCYDVIGLQELYGPSLRIVEARSGLPAGCLGGTSRSNTVGGKAKPSGCYRVSAEQLAQIEGRNAYDLALFYTVLAQLYRTYGDMLPPLTGLDDLAGVRPD